MRFIILVVLSFSLSIASAAEELASYDVDFDGGSALDFSEILGNLGINAIFPENAEMIDIPAIRLRNVTQLDLFNALNIIGREAPIQFNWGRSGNDLPMIIGPDGQVSNDQSNQIWVLSSTGSRKTAQPFAIGPLLVSESNENGFSVDDITSAIASAAEAAAAAEGRISDLGFQYHEGTQLLIITGRVEDVRVASQTLRTLRQSRLGAALEYGLGGQFGVEGQYGLTGQFGSPGRFGSQFYEQFWESGQGSLYDRYQQPYLANDGIPPN